MPPFETGRPVPLSPLVQRVLAPNPSVFTGPGTNTYLVGRDELAVIDPGPDDPRHRDALLAAVDDRLRWILVTHTHIDHSPGAAALAAATGAEVFGFDARDGFQPTDDIGEGWRLTTDEFELRALHTPGHASNHLCYLLEGERGLFSGDHIMSGSTVVIRPPDGDMAAYRKALHRLADDFELVAIYPAHGDVIEDPAGKIEEYLDHRQAHEDAILARLGSAGPQHVEQIVTAVYTDVSPTLHPIARYSVWAHLRELVAAGRVRGDADDLNSAWELAS